MANPQQMGDYLRNIINHIDENIDMLETEKELYGKFMRFVLGINRNLRRRKRQLEYYENLLEEYIKDGRAI